MCVDGLCEICLKSLQRRMELIRVHQAAGWQWKLKKFRYSDADDSMS
jgi:hypothetical protein